MGSRAISILLYGGWVGGSLTGMGDFRSFVGVIGVDGASIDRDDT